MGFYSTNPVQLVVDLIYNMQQGDIYIHLTISTRYIYLYTHTHLMKQIYTIQDPARNLDIYTYKIYIFLPPVTRIVSPLT